MAEQKYYYRIGIVGEDSRLTETFRRVVVRWFEAKGSTIKKVNNVHTVLETNDYVYSLICYSNYREWSNIADQKANDQRVTDGIIVLEDMRSEPDRELLEKHIRLAGKLKSACAFILDTDESYDPEHPSERQTSWNDAISKLFQERNTEPFPPAPVSVQKALDNPAGEDCSRIIDMWIMLEAVIPLTDMYKGLFTSSGQSDDKKSDRSSTVQATEAAKTTAYPKKPFSKTIAKAIIWVMILLAFGVGVLYYISVRPKQQLAKALQYLDSGEYEKAYEIIEKTRNTKEVKSSVKERAEKLVQVKEYETAYRLIETIQDKETVKAYKKDLAILILEAEDYDAAYDLLEQIHEGEAVKESKYERAMSLIESGDYEGAYNLLGQIEYYKDSKNQREAITLDYYFATALRLFSERNFDEGSSWLTKAGDDNYINTKRYAAAMEKIQAKEYEAAWLLLDNLDYNDSEEKQKAIRMDYRWEQLVNAEKGSIVGWGSYEQDNDPENGKEDIEWVVLTREGNKLLLLSKNALDCLPYDTSGNNVTWESCTLRAWMNEYFLVDAFDEDERNYVLSVTVTADPNPTFSSEQGNDTQDLVFCLSIEEVEKYLPEENDRRTNATDFAQTKSPYVQGNWGCGWWLRTLGIDNRTASIITSSGLIYGTKDEIYQVGTSVGDAQTAVRPAVWLDLGSRSAN